MSITSIVDSVSHRYQVLDGWRGFSILCVLAAHLLPLGPKSWQLNSMVGPLGMSLFFVLSGFLITNFLIKKPTVTDFLVRRFFRILPLVWLYLLIVLPILDVETDAYLPHFLFYVNTPPIEFLVKHGTGHLWSLCIEVQFYIGVAVLYALMKERGLLLLPVICIAITCYRIANGVHISIVTPFRIDEILTGCILALAYSNKLGKSIPELLRYLNPYWLLALLLVACHPDGGFMNYLRPYLAALLIGVTLYQKDLKINHYLSIKALIYIAGISYALYVIHPILLQTWLASGDDKIITYLKRPLLFIVLFLAAHVSTFYYEKYWISLGKTISGKLNSKK